MTTPRRPVRNVPRSYDDARYRANRAHLRKIDHVCHRCGGDIDPKLRWPHPLSWSCGHIVAVANLPADDPRHWHLSNLQAEHLRCNESGGKKSPRRAVPSLPWAD